MSMEPRFYINASQYMDAAGILTSTHGGTLANLYDNDLATLWQSAGANSDATTVTLDYTLIGGVAQHVDQVIFKAHNIKSLEVYYYNGSAWVSIATATGITSANTSVQFSGVIYNRFKIELKTTQTANLEKSIGELMFFGAPFRDFQEMSAYEPRPREKSKLLTMGDGSIHSVYSRSGGLLTKWGAQVRFRYLTKAQRDTLRTIKELGQAFYFQPLSVTAPEEIYRVLWVSPWAERFSTDFFGAGYDVTLEVREV